MGIGAYASIWIGYANIFIATFIMIYAYLFLRQTNVHKDRRPWDFLFFASFLYFVFQVFNVLFLSGVTSILGDTIDIDIVRNLFAFLFSGSVLLAFVSQHDLILKSQLILISKKDKFKPVVKEELDITIGGGKK
jgi:hypothetical protein